MVLTLSANRYTNLFLLKKVIPIGGQVSITNAVLENEPRNRENFLK